MGHDWSWAELFPILKDQPHVFNGIIVSAILLIIVFLGYSQLKKTEDDIIPSPKLTFRNFVELLADGLANMIVDTMGPRGKEFILIVGTLAIFILFNNVSGLIPGFLPATDNVNTTFACSLTVFFLTHYYGFKEHGFKYLKQFVGPMWALAPLMIPIEIIGHLARPLSLGLRLFGNMTGDHLVTAIFFSLVPVLIPVVPMLLGLFVAFVQAFVFMLLSMAYFSGAISHEEH